MPAAMDLGVPAPLRKRDRWQPMLEGDPVEADHVRRQARPRLSSDLPQAMRGSISRAGSPGGEARAWRAGTRYVVGTSQESVISLRPS